MSKCLCIIKPDAIKEGNVGRIISMIENRGASRIIIAQTMQLSYEKACEFYQEHKGKDFFERNVLYMSSGPVLVLIVEDVLGVKYSQAEFISDLRKLAGDTDPKKAAVKTIRGLYGSKLPANAIHVSDSPEAVLREVQILFPGTIGII
jgi:nucleoside-diphosphate kinase